jgi:hypothetical protein
VRRPGRGPGGPATTAAQFATTVDAKHHAASWLPDELLAGETWLLRLMNVDGALVMNVGPTTEPAGRATACAAVAAPAVDTGTLIAIALSAAARARRRVRMGFMSNGFRFACRFM